MDEAVIDSRPDPLSHAEIEMLSFFRSVSSDMALLRGKLRDALERTDDPGGIATLSAHLHQTVMTESQALTQIHPLEARLTLDGSAQ